VRASLPLRLLFEVTAICPRLDSAWDMPLTQWPAESRLPDLCAVDAEQPFAAVHVSWNTDGLFVGVRVPKQGPVVVNRQRPESGDCLQVWVDTRPDTASHRASRHCHRFVLLPRGSGPNKDEPTATMAWIARAYDQATRCAPAEIPVRVEVGEGSYALVACLSTRILAGFSPHPGVLLGFNYLVTDVPLGRQTWSSGPPLPFDRDPRLWGRIRLA